MNEWTGRDSNQLNHVLQIGSQVCFKTIDEVVCQRIYGALSRLSYNAVVSIIVAPMGFEPMTSGSLSMYSNSAVDCYLFIGLSSFRIRNSHSSGRSCISAVSPMLSIRRTRTPRTLITYSNKLSRKESNLRFPACHAGVLATGPRDLYTVSDQNNAA
jgi:hypothetical protein